MPVTVAGEAAHRRAEPTLPTADADDVRSHAPRRGVELWDLVGLAWLGALMFGVRELAVAMLDTGLGRADGLRVAAIVWTAVTALATIALIAFRRARLRDLPGRLTQVWRDPPGAWVAAVEGALLSIPVFALYTPVLLHDADSARIVAGVTHVNEHGIGFLRDTQSNLLPHVVFGPVVEVWGLGGVKFVAMLSMLALGAVVAYVTYRVTLSLVGAGAAAIAALAIPSLLERGGYVPMYPAMLALGYLGGWFAYRAVTERDRRWGPAVAAGVCIALAPEAQPVGILFVFAPLLVTVFAPTWRAAVGGVLRTYLVVAVVSVPRLLLNLSEGGTSYLVSYRTDFWSTEGYLPIIQRDLWHYAGIDETLGHYLERLPIRFADGFGGQGSIVIWLAIAGWLLACRGRGRLFVGLVAGGFLLAITVKQVPPFSRYYSPMWPGFAILVGVGVGRLVRLRPAVARIAGVGLVGALVVAAAVSFRGVADDEDGFRAQSEDGPYRDLAAEIDDGKGVIGARSHALVNVTADIPTWGGQFLTEDEYVTYLSWPSDEEVVEVLDRHDIGWALVHRLPLLEITYHDTWMVPTHGLRARQPTMLAESPLFCRVAGDDGFVLYRLGPCQPGDEGDAPADAGVPPSDAGIPPVDEADEIVDERLDEG